MGNVYFGFSHVGSVAVAVLIILAVMSVFSWAFIFYKWLQLKGLDRKNKVFLNKFIETKDKTSLEAFAKASDSIAGKLYLLNKESSSSAFTFFEMIARELEGGFPWLASVGATAPFVGLFGTVWGIINAFNNIGNVQSVTIATVAPGISEALITTAAGIFVAVPAVIGYNILHTKLSSLLNELDGFLEALSR
ncbi:MotA/TolQ/ExbB proton channel family protein [Hippea maritima]|uniref:MotA/TolQ/ExbB proton channel n=1 Tax=Hippea maritima (strain ATCC 700847 / DSM 10411 / MH2) TaxID=760142 RepID=F2LW24_HIPMA|nr:MotA/TolQ/ExbB proton channel family protein [Hippea maritima]AEA33958.1 MotA/TolQ/ExbB proton channel [Hippea maritima DSM 10411]